MPTTTARAPSAQARRAAVSATTSADRNAAAQAAAATYTITELAAEFDVTPRAIRFYEDVGLLTPQRAGRNRVETAGAASVGAGDPVDVESTDLVESFDTVNTAECV